MNLVETTELLAMIAAFDRRTVGESDVRAWHAVLSDIDLADAIEAVRHHYRQRLDWMMPAHVIVAVREIEQARARATRRWAPGQYGVPADQPVPEATTRATSLADVPAPLRKLIGGVARDDRHGVSSE